MLHKSLFDYLYISSCNAIICTFIFAMRVIGICNASLTHYQWGWDLIQTSRNQHRLRRDSRLLETSSDLHSNVKPIRGNQEQWGSIQANIYIYIYIGLDISIRTHQGQYRWIGANRVQSGMRPIGAYLEIIRYNWGKQGRFKVNLALMSSSCPPC